MLSGWESMHRIVHFESLINKHFVKLIVPSSTLISRIESIKTFFSCILLQKRLYQFARLPAVKLDIHLVHFHYLRALWLLCFCWLVRFWGESFVCKIEHRWKKFTRQSLDFSNQLRPGFVWINDNSDNNNVKPRPAFSYEAYAKKIE